MPLYSVLMGGYHNMNFSWLQGEIELENEEGEASAAVLFATFGQDPVCLLKLNLSEFMLPANVYPPTTDLPGLLTEWN
ncbi:hypothetical protein CMV_006560 [Castanea mollissima]|uniref:Uncharacterized protein n=1 Tax=Castanea mollissima TaxID=60419 RepID=A0A8J4RQT4_9ROSI|nr:hypothetical protein CMV_006560 [Castanea mollissima]